tara:strand:- start:2050 stop:3222 length:1173 start_codon:yes stop_codon:yes gene_type:complete
MNKNSTHKLKDLDLMKVRVNNIIISRLKELYKIWGYDEVSPQYIDNLETLKAGGAINIEEISKLVSDDPIGLRPEMTSIIVRNTCGISKNKLKPLKLFTNGTVFKRRINEEGHLIIEEKLQSGIEIIATEKTNIEIEALTILMESIGKLKIDKFYNIKLLLNSTELMELILRGFDVNYRKQIREYLVKINQVDLSELKISEDDKIKLLEILYTRGEPIKVLKKLENFLGKNKTLEALKDKFNILSPIAKSFNLDIQLDPTFQPHFNLYAGIVFNLICDEEDKHTIIAKGGRYDELIDHFNKDNKSFAGIGFTFSIDNIRELLMKKEKFIKIEKTLVAFGPNKNINVALDQQRILHKKNIITVLELNQCNTKDDALSIASNRGCINLHWIN